MKTKETKRRKKSESHWKKKEPQKESRLVDKTCKAEQLRVEVDGFIPRQDGRHQQQQQS